MAMSNEDYRKGMVQFIREWKKEVWPMMQSEGFTSMDVAFSIYMLQRVELSIDQAFWTEEEEPKEPWQQ